MRIRAQLLTLSAIPLCGVVAMGVTGTWERVRVKRDADNALALTDLAVRSSGLVHELQKERAYSTGFLNGDGVAFSNELKAQRVETDTARKALEDYLEKARGGAATVRVQGAIKDATDRLSQLGSLRERVTGRSVPAAEEIAYFTDTNASFLDLIDRLATVGDQADITRAVVAYSSLLRSKECSGIERAVVANALGRGTFPAGGYVRFVSAVNSQAAYTRLFVSLASEEQRESFASHMRAPAVAEVETMRSTVGERASAENLGVPVAAWISATTARIDVLRALEVTSGALSALAARTGSRATTALAIYAGATAVLAGALALGTVLVRRITRRLVLVSSRARSIADADLSARTSRRRGSDELTDLTKAVNGMSTSLRSIVTGVSRSTTAVASAATEISASAEEMAGTLKSQEQAAAQVAAAVAEMSSSVGQIANMSGQAAESAKAAGGRAADGGAVVGRATEEMLQMRDVVSSAAENVRSLAERAEGTGKVLSVISDIADQTNLLALNAAIEAARAGEHGRGFAVVADEVRKLAERTQLATREVATSIGGIQTGTSDAVARIETCATKASTGAALAQDAAKALTQIVEGSSAVHVSVESISATVTQQASAAEEIARSIDSISAATRETCQAATQSAQAASSLSRESETLQSLVRRFVL